MAIIPETKDWTWVLSQECPECGFDASAATPAAVRTTLADQLPRWQTVLNRPDVAQRPDDYTWSALEYACHVRDVFDLFQERLRLIRTEDNPTFPNWDQDATAVAENYAAQDPATVANQLTEAGESSAAAWTDVPESEWERVGLRSNGSTFTVRTLAGYFLHDVVHHLHDVNG